MKLKPIDNTRLTHSFAENAHIACNNVLRHGIKWGQKMIHTGRIIDLNTHAELLERSGTKLHDMSHSSMEAMLTSDNTTGNGITFYQQHIVRMSAPVDDEGEHVEDHRNDLNTRTCQTRYGNNMGINIVKADLSCKLTV